MTAKANAYSPPRQTGRQDDHPPRVSFFLLSDLNRLRGRRAAHVAGVHFRGDLMGSCRNPLLWIN